MNNEKFHSERRIGIGGSDIAAIFGLSNFQTAIDVYNSKVEEFEDEILAADDPRNIGKLCEPIILKIYEGKTGNRIVTDNTFIQSKQYPWMIGHVDGWLPDINKILEAKHVGFFSDKWGQSGTDGVPDAYLLQVAHYCLIASEFKEILGADIAALGNGNQFRIYHYNRNEKLEKAIIDRVKFFWHENVLAKIPPQPTTLNDLSRFWKSVEGKSITAPDSLYLKWSELSNVAKTISDLSEKENLLKAEIQKEMADAETLLDNMGNKIVSWKTQTKKLLDQRKLKEGFKQIYDDCCKESVSRIFRVVR